MGRHADAPDLVDCLQFAVKRGLSCAVVPADHVARFDTEREPMPGQRGRLLTDDDQQLLLGEVSRPPAVALRSVVFRRGEEVKTRRTGLREHLFL